MPGKDILRLGVKKGLWLHLDGPGAAEHLLLAAASSLSAPLPHAKHANQKEQIWSA